MQRTLIIGDIHGCFDELLDLLAAAQLKDEDVVVSVGDLVDRGPKPAEVIAWFRARPGAVVLMGNHERKHVRGVLSYSQEVTRLQLGEGYAEAVEWMKGLPYFYETEVIRVVHAALDPELDELAAQAPAVLAGTTSGEKELAARLPEGTYWHEHYRGPRPVAFGHHVVKEPLLRDGLIYGLDTGCCHGGHLTALSVPDFQLHSVPARANHWPVVARHYQLPLLRAKPWAAMSWRKLDETVAERMDDRIGEGSAEANAYLAAVASWAGELRALIPALFARVPELAAELRAAHGEAWQAAAAAHPARPLLFQHGRGRLELKDLEARCSGPAATLALAEKLGLRGSWTSAPPV